MKYQINFMQKLIFVLVALLFNNARGQSNEWLSIGIVRTDGIIIPTHRLQSNVWKDITAKAREFRFFESTITEWYFIPFSSAPYYLKVGSLVNYDPDNDISSGYGYISDYNPHNLTRYVFPIRKVGISFSKKVSARIFKTINDSSKVWKDIYDLVSHGTIKVDTNYMEMGRWDKYFGKNHIVEFDRIYLKGVQADSFNVYYFEANYRVGNSGCQLIIYSNGWIIYRDNKYKVINDFIGFDDCDFKMLSGALVTPLSVIKMNNHYYLYLINQAWEGEDYSLWQITKNKIVRVN